MELYNISNYTVNKNPLHHNDINLKDQFQKEVYVFCKDFMKNNNLQTVVDIGCGSGYKLVTILNEFNTIGVETEPCYSFLKSKYPHLKWLLSGEKERSFRLHDELYNSDVIICSDVIEHIVDPNILVEYLLSLKAKYYIISTPCREVLCNNPKFSNDYGSSFHGPPINPAHVREWTMPEFKQYMGKYFNIISSHYDKMQLECQYHLLTIK